MAVESTDDLAGFFDPDEFGAEATLSTADGDVSLTGTPSAVADNQRPGATNNSSISTFVVGAADMSVTTILFICTWAKVAGAHPDDTLTILEGDYAGTWRVRDIQRNGAQARLMLNAL